MFYEINEYAARFLDREEKGEREGGLTPIYLGIAECQNFFI